MKRAWLYIAVILAASVPLVAQGYISPKGYIGPNGYITGNVGNVVLGTITADGSVTCSNTTAAAATLTCPLTSVTAGDLITCPFQIDSGGSNPNSYVKISDPTNGIYKLGMFTGDGNSNVFSNAEGVSYFENAAGGSYTVTLTSSASNQLSITCKAWKNALTSGALDTGSINISKVQATSATNPTAGTAASPQGNNELIMGVVTSNTQTPTAGTNYALFGNMSANFGFAEFWIQTTSTATNAPYTMASDVWFDGQTAFLPSGATAGLTVLTGPILTMEGGSNGVQPTAATMQASTTPGSFAEGAGGNQYAYGRWAACNGGAGNCTAITFATAAQMTCNTNTVFVAPPTGVSGSFNDSGSLGFQYATGTAGQSYAFAFGGTYTSVTESFCFKTDIPQNDSNTHAYSLGTINGGAGDSCNPQIQPSGTALGLNLEAPEGSIPTAIPFSSNTVYKVVMQYITSGGGCTLAMYDTSGNQLSGSPITRTNAAGSFPATQVTIGISGGETEAAGDHIYIDNLRISTQNIFPI